MATGETILRTSICDLLDIKYPILLAGMGEASTPELAAAVSNAGGLGVLGASAQDPDGLSEWIQRTRKLTSQPFGVNTLLPSGVPSGGEKKQLRAEIPQTHLDFARAFQERHGIPRPDPTKSRTQSRMTFSRDFFKKQLEVILDERVPVYAAGLGDPAFLMPEARARGMKVIAIAGAVKHARGFKEGGVDIIVAQGTDGGGHNSRVGTMALVPQVVDLVSPIPVLGAGGIADGRGLVAALALGAVGVWCGTPFLATPEAGIDDFQKEAIVESNADDTVVTRSLTGKPVRVLKNLWSAEFEASGLQPLPMPFQPLLAFRVLEAARQANRKDIYPGAAGQSVGLLHRVRPAREIVEEMVQQAVEILTERFPRDIQVRR